MRNTFQFMKQLSLLSVPYYIIYINDMLCLANTFFSHTVSRSPTVWPRGLHRRHRHCRQTQPQRTPGNTAAVTSTLVFMKCAVQKHGEPSPDDNARCSIIKLGRW